MSKDKKYKQTQENLQNKINNLVMNGEIISPVNISEGITFSLGITKSKYVQKEDFYIIGNYIIVIQELIDMIGDKFELKTIYEFDDETIKTIIEESK